MKTAAFFDLDDTIVAGNSGMRCAAWYFFRGRISVSFALRTLFRYLFYFLGKEDPYRFFGDIYLFMKGRSSAAERKVFHQFFATNVQNRIFADAAKAIGWHKGQGHAVVVVTNSLEEMIAPIKKVIGADALIASRLEEHDGLYTGRTAVICFGRNKARFVREYARRENVSLKKSYAYSDNGSDTEMLSVVGNPVAVNPQRRLRNFATGHGWKIVQWR